MGPHDLVARAYDLFRDDLASPPPLTLRGGNTVDSYERPEPYDAAIDEPTDQYLEGYGFWGLGYLDARSWRHYLPRLIDYSLRRREDPAMAVEALVRSLRPPDRYPPRLATLSPDQESAVREFLELLALGDLVPGLEGEAQQALEEWWLPQPRSRPTAGEIAAARAEPMTYRSVGSGGYGLVVPITLTGGDAREIPEESRRVETWGGYLCHDVHTVIAINVTPAAARSFADVLRHRSGLFLRQRSARDVTVPGARTARRIDGWMLGDSPAEPQQLTMLVAEAGDRIFTLTIHTWPREDVAREVERIVASFAIASGARS
jgi:hypothetical protein